MRYLLLGIFLSMTVYLFGQNEVDKSPYQKRKITKVETDILMSFYTQDGDHSAVTGGKGSEQLNDLATNVEINIKMDGKKKGNENSIKLKFGVDAYTSASSDMIDPNTISSASSGDTRVYPSIAYQHSNGQGRYDLGGNISFSSEYDYLSIGSGFQFAKRSPGNNSEIGIRFQSFYDLVSVIYPIEFRAGDKKREDLTTRYSNSLSLSFSQVLNRRMNAALLIDGVMQNGFLSSSFHRTVFNDRTLVENLPDSRLKLPIGLRLNYFVSDHLITKFYYRYYMDDWGIEAHTYSIEVPVKIKPWFSIYPKYRYYAQTGMDYFIDRESNFQEQAFYSNDYDLSTFDSHFYGLGLRFAPPNGLFGYKQYFRNTEFNFKYGYYDRSDGLSSHIVSIHFKFLSQW